MGEGNPERRPERVEQDVREARIAAGDHELGGLHSTGQKGAQRDSAPRTPARDAQCRPQRKKQRRVQDAVGERPVAAQHTEDWWWSVRGLERNERHSQNHCEPQDREPIGPQDRIQALCNMFLGFARQGKHSITRIDEALAVSTGRRRARECRERRCQYVQWLASPLRGVERDVLLWSSVCHHVKRQGKFGESSRR